MQSGSVFELILTTFDDQFRSILESKFNQPICYWVTLQRVSFIMEGIIEMYFVYFKLK